MPRLLDLCCKAGGCSVGYARAGFEVVGVDNTPQPRYPFTFVQADALTYPLDGFDVVHASPPCQKWSDLAHLSGREYPDLIEPIRRRLIEWGGVYVIENVERAPLIDPITLCGTMFDGLRVIRHRLFESNAPIGAPGPCQPHPLCFTSDKRKPHYGALDDMYNYVTVTGGGNCSIAAARDAMGIPWMTKGEINQAIPPAYTEHIGGQIAGFLAQATADA